MKKWYVKNSLINYNDIATKFNISPLMAKLLANRDIAEDKLIMSFLNPTLKNLHDPKDMKDISKAINIIKEKIHKGKKIRIIGDYDVDGVISTYILYVALKRCGAVVDYEIPDRIKDGYGINLDIVTKSKEDKVDTIITCDNGIAAIDTIEQAKVMELTVIVTDHHDIPFEQDEDGNRTFIESKADAIINPKQNNCGYEFKKLCGAAVALKFIEALYEEFNIEKNQWYKFIEFVAIATVCDVVDLVDENRVIVKKGLEMLNRTENLGLKALIKISNIDNIKLTTYHLGFVIGPCINASGRLDNAKRGLRLLLSNSEEEARILAKELYDLNQERKDMTAEGIEEALKIIEKDKLEGQKVLLIYIKNLHESLAGIVAGRIRERFNVPTIVLTRGENIIKGSGRSIEGYNMFEELLKCKDLIVKFGGHPMAAGLSLEEHNIEPLRNMLNHITTLKDEDLIPRLNLDMQLPFQSINYDLIKELEGMEPFGKGNSKPIFGERKIKAIRARVMGQNKNVLKLGLVSRNGIYIEGIYFSNIEEFDNVITEKYGKEQLDNLYMGTDNNIYLDIAYYPNINEFNGTKTLQLVIEEIR